MGSSGSSTPQNIVTTQNKDPWSGAQPHLQAAMTSAASMFNNQQGYQPYTGQTQAAIDPWLAIGLNNTVNAASQPSIINSARDLATNMVNQEGLTAGHNTALGGLMGAASGYSTVYNQNAGQANPYLQGVMDAQGRKIADQVNSAMSGGGRYGSGAHTNVLSRNLAEAQLPLLAQDYAQRQQTQLAALGGLGQMSGAIGDVYSGGLNRAGQFSQLMPTLEQAKYGDLDRMTQAGQYMTDRAQAQLASDIQRYNAQQAYPWEQLARYNAIAGGAGGLGGSSVTSAPNVNAPVGGLQGALGGALAGGAAGTSIFGPGVGSLAGAGIGGLLGYLR